MSVAYHDTEFGNLPFLLIGEGMQKYANCNAIEYPDFRSASGWMCKGLADGETSTDTARLAAAGDSSSATVRTAASAIAVLAAALAALALAC